VVAAFLSLFPPRLSLGVHDRKDDMAVEQGEKLHEKGKLDNGNELELDALHMELDHAHARLHSLMQLQQEFPVRCSTYSMYKLWVLHCHVQTPVVHLIQI